MWLTENWMELDIIVLRSKFNPSQKNKYCIYYFIFHIPHMWRKRHESRRWPIREEEGLCREREKRDWWGRFIQCILWTCVNATVKAIVFIINKSILKIKIQERLYKNILESLGKTAPNWKWPHVQEKGQLN